MQNITETMLQNLQSGSATDRLKKELLEAIRSQGQLGLNSTPAQLAFSNNLAKMTNRERDHHFKMHLLEQLSYENELDREYRIERAYERTFEWIFTHEHCEGHRDKQWSNFAHWLGTDDDPLYWITGKAGSGKLIPWPCLDLHKLHPLSEQYIHFRIFSTESIVGTNAFLKWNYQPRRDP